MSDFNKDYEREYWSKQQRREARELRRAQRDTEKMLKSAGTRRRSSKGQPSGCAVIGFLLIGGLALLSI
jgi:hypothetical protein